MCGRYIDPDEAFIERIWKIDRRNWNPFVPRRMNVAPTMEVPIIRRHLDGTLELTGVRWGLVPFWWKKETLPGLTFNARSEEAASKPMWRDSLRSKRCIMPAGGWYEWAEHQKAVNPSGKPCNQPYFHYCQGEPTIGIAGIWSVWKTPAGNELHSCALLTKEAAPSVAHIHHRMPVILRADLYDAWLDASNPPADIIAAAREDFSAHPVSTRINSARNDSPDLILPIQIA